MDKKSLANRSARRTKLTLAADAADYIEEKLSGDKKLRKKTSRQKRLRFEIKPFKSELMPGIIHRKIEELIDEI